MRRSALLTMAGLAALTAALGLSGAASVSVAQPAAAAASGPCASMTKAGQFAQTTVASATSVAADAAKGLPAYCEVTGTISPVAGSNIGVIYRLPEGWNGKMLGLGGGGWAGNLRIESAYEGLKAGYATAQTDGGHPSTGPWETAWASNPEAITDFSHRAIHLMTEVGKQVVKGYYGRAQTKAYYQGCSTGGRMGLMEVQRYPADYDAAIIGAPVYNLTTQTSAVVRNNTFSTPGAALTEALLKTANQAALKACDAKDGLADGLINDPGGCAWDPAEIQCKAGAAGTDCLNEAQVNVLRTVYRGVQTVDGRVAAWPLAKGGEPGWSRFVSITGPDASNGGGLGGLRGPIMGDPTFDLAKFNPDQDLSKVRSGAFAKAYEANDPAITAFAARGGKVLIWHGWNDPGPSPVATVTYFNQVKGALGPDQSTARLFLAPGVEHCGGGPGPSQVDFLGALDRWVQTGQAPATLIANKASPKMSRTLCAYPAVARYKGSGDANDASSFECR